MLERDGGEEPLWQSPTKPRPWAAPTIAATLVLARLAEAEAEAANVPATECSPIAIPRPVEPRQGICITLPRGPTELTVT